MFIAQNKYDKAEKILLFAINKLEYGKKEIFTSKALLGYVYLKSGYFTKALEYLKSAINDNPFYGPAWLYLAYVYSNMNNMSMYKICLQKVKDLGYKIPEQIERMVYENK